MEKFIRYFGPGGQDGRLFVLRSRRIEEFPSSKNPPPIEEVAPTSLFRPIFDLLFEAEDRRTLSSIFWSEDRRLKKGELFVLRLRKSKTESSSLFSFEDRRRYGSSKMEGSLNKK